MIVSNPNRPLNRSVEMSKWEYFCQKIAPYIIVFCIGLLSVLIFIALVKYGANWTGTEANGFYNHIGDL